MSSNHIVFFQNLLQVSVVIYVNFTLVGVAKM